MERMDELFDLEHTLAGRFLAEQTYPWELLPNLSALILELSSTLDSDFIEVRPQVWVHRTASIAPMAHLEGPCIIGANTQVRHCAFIRGSALVGEDCVIGNSVEVKNAILFDRVETPHYNYVGDSILGFHAHMGAGAITSNVRADYRAIIVKDGERKIETGLDKMGAMVGDYAEIGCNSVLNPGTVIGRRSVIYPLSNVRGVIPAGCILKTGGAIVKRRPAEDGPV